MDSINSVVIEGNLVRDVTFKETSKGTHLCTFSIAANRNFTSANGDISKEVSYFDVETWGAVADECIKKGEKGRGIRLVGRLKQNRWTGSDGKNYSRITIIAEHAEFRAAFKKKEQDSSSDEDAESTSTIAKLAATAAVIPDAVPVF